MKKIQLFCSVMALIVALSGALRAEDKAPVLVITKAEYGDLPDGTKSDVTEKVKGMVNAEGLNVEATNDNFGDPVEGTVKKLKVEYTLDDKKLDKTVEEGATLTIPLKKAEAAKIGKLKIVAAFYGDLPDGTKAEVTDTVQGLVKDDALSIGATNENFGDPVPGTVKKLKVDYSFDGGAKKTKEVEENETLKVSNKGE